MIWIWLLARQSHSFWAPLARYLTFVCEHCGASFPAHVQTVGIGRGSNQHAAMVSASIAAEANVQRAMLAAACPSCSKLPPATLEVFRRAEEKLA